MKRTGKHRAETAPRDIGHSLREAFRHIGDIRDQVQDVGAERALLGSLIVENSVANEVIRIVEPAAFLFPGHRAIFETIIRLYDARKSIDLTILHHELSNAKALDAVGGLDYLAGLLKGVPSAANAGQYAEIVHEKYMRRELIRAGYEILRLAAESEEDPKALLDRAMQVMFDNVRSEARAAPASIGDLLRETFRGITDFRDRKSRVTGIETGLYDLDDLTTGLHPGQFVIVAGRPGMGRTSLASNLALHAGVELCKPILFFSLETNGQSIALNMLCTHARYDSQKIRKGLISEEEYAHLMRKAGEFQEAPIFIDDASGLSALDLRATARRLKAEHKIEMVIVDSLQLMEISAQDRRDPDGHPQGIAPMARLLKALALELDVAVIATSELKQRVDARADRRPVMSDLPESGALERIADVVLMLYRDEYYLPDTIHRNMAEIILAKQRNGPTGAVRLRFLKEYARFENATGLDVEPPQ